MIKKNIKWFVLCAVCLIGGIVCFYALYERVEYQQRIPESYSVRHKIFYTAEQFLKQQGIHTISTKHRRRLLNLPEPTSAIFVPFLSDDLSEAQVQNLLAWVNQGGRLFVFADPDEIDYEDDQTSDNPILREMNVRVVASSSLFPEASYEYDDFAIKHWVACLDDAQCNTLNAPDGVEGNGDHHSDQQKSEQTRYAFDDRADTAVRDAVYLSRVKPTILNENGSPYELDENLVLSLDRTVSLDVYDGQADVVFQSDASIVGVQFYKGKGVISIFNSYDFLSQTGEQIKQDERLEGTGNHIGRYDHAYFLWQSVKDRSSVWFFESTQYTGFVKLALKNLPYFLLTAAVGIVFFLLWLSQRIGPYHPSISQPRRSMLEHLQMSADFEWRLDKCETLLKNNQAALLNLIHKKHPKTKRLNEAKAMRYLSHRLGMSQEHIYTALHAHAENEKQFITISQYIHTLRNAL